MSDEPSNAASDYMRRSIAFLNESGSRPEKRVRAGLTDDFTYRDQRSGPTFNIDADAESYAMLMQTYWETGAGRPRFEVLEIVAVRAERFAALVMQLDYGNGMAAEGIQVVGLDVTLTLLQCSVAFDIDDVDGAIAELDRLHNQHAPH